MDHITDGNSEDKEKALKSDSQLIANLTAGLVKFAVKCLAVVPAVNPTHSPETSVMLLVASEITSAAIDNQKMKIATFAELLAKKRSLLPPEKEVLLVQRINSEEGARIYADAFQQAANSIDVEKLEAIACLLKNSLSSETLQEHQTRWMLKLLDKIDHVQIVILRSYIGENRSQFIAEHPHIFQGSEPPERPFFRTFTYPRDGTQEQNEEINRLSRVADVEYEKQMEAYKVALETHSLYQSRLHHLVELGLLGALTRHRASVAIDIAATPLGAALLKIIDAVPLDTWGQGTQTNAVDAMKDAMNAAQSNLNKSWDDFARGF